MPTSWSADARDVALWNELTQNGIGWNVPPPKLSRAPKGLEADYVFLPRMTAGRYRRSSDVGHCGDNAACEGFFGVLKRERIYRMNYPTLDAARADVFEYIERFHNPRMRRRIARQDLKFSTLSQPSVISG